MTHEQMHLYLEAVCLSVGTRPRDWGEALRVTRVLCSRGRLPSVQEVLGEQDGRTSVLNWLDSALSTTKGD